MKFALISLGVFVIASVFFLGEPAWLILVCVFAGRIAFCSRHLALRCAAVASAVAILAAHFAGYKFVGSATIHDNRPILHSPHVLASLDAPNILLVADGTRFELQGVTFSPELLALPAGDLQRMLSGRREPVLVEADATSPSGVVFQRHCNYWCGNTFYPSFMPQRLPAYSRTDLGRFLADNDLATRHHAE